MDIVTLTLNPCVDRTIWVDDFGGEARKTEYQTGGKGMNVARVLGNLGVECAAVCPVGGAEGERFLGLARAENIHIAAVRVDAETRVIDTYARSGDMAQRVDYAKGGALGETELDGIERTLFDLLPGAKALAICGSASCESAARRVPWIISKARALGVPVFLDSNGEALRLGAQALPDIIKPNQKELLSLTGDAGADGARRLAATGAEVLLSLGEAGCLYVFGEREEYCPAPKVNAVNAVGSGDCFSAAFIYASLKGYALKTSLMIACAAGAANAEVFPAARISRRDIEKLLSWEI